MGKIADRFKQRRHELGLSQQELADRAGVAQQTIAKIESGNTDNPRRITALADALQTTERWLISGSGEKTREAEPGTDILVPVYSFRAGMGGGGVNLDDGPTGVFPLPERYALKNRLDAAALISFEAEGDSMSPTLESGDQVMVDTRDKNPARGGIFAIFDSNTLVIKRIEKIPATDPVRLRLISENPMHGNYDVVADDTNIVGRVVWYGRRL